MKINRMLLFILTLEPLLPSLLWICSKSIWASSSSSSLWGIVEGTGFCLHFFFFLNGFFIFTRLLTSSDTGAIQPVLLLSFPPKACIPKVESQQILWRTSHCCAMIRNKIENSAGSSWMGCDKRLADCYCLTKPNTQFNKTHSLLQGVVTTH